MRIHDRIEEQMQNWGRFAAKRSIWILLAMSLFTGYFGSHLSSLKLEASTESFVREDDPERIRFNEFRAAFGREDFILILLEPENVFDFKFIERLRALHEELESIDQINEVDSLINARNTYGVGDELIVEDLFENWPENQAELEVIKQRALANPLYENVFISTDGRVAGMMVETDAYSAVDQDADALEGFGNTPEENINREFLTGPELSTIIAAVDETLARYADIAPVIHVAGQPVMISKIRGLMSADMQRFMSLSILVVAALLYLLFRRVSGVFLPITVVASSVVATMGVMAASGTSLSLPTQTLPSLLLAVGVGSSVHMLSIFYTAYARTQNKMDAIAHAMGHAGLPIAMTALTTAGGLLSFMRAELALIADVGIFGPIGILFSLLYTMILLPALLGVLPIRFKDDRRSEGPAILNRVLLGVGDFATQHPKSILAGAAIIVSMSLMGAMKINYSHNPLHWFEEDEPIRVASEYANERMAGSGGVELWIKTGTENGFHDPTLLHNIEAFKTEAFNVRVGPITPLKIISITDTVMEINQALNANQPEYRVIPDDRQLIAQEFLLFENSGSDDLEDIVDSQFSHSRTTLRIPWNDAILFVPFFNDLHIVAAKTLGDNVEFALTGLSYLAGKTISAVIHTMATSYILALVIITPLMMLLIGSLRGGLVSMVPNLTPIITTLGVMGWMGIPMDAFTLLVGSIAIGLAVDDTIHFMHHFQRYYRLTGDPREAVKRTLETTGRALLFTSIVLSLGFFVFMFATMTNLFYFGFLTGFAIISAFVADILITPALVVLVRSRLGEREPMPGLEQGMDQ